jgi:hypothetical protein
VAVPGIALDPAPSLTWASPSDARPGAAASHALKSIRQIVEFKGSRMMRRR